MGHEYMTLGTTPTEEECAQVGEASYFDKVNFEGRVYIEQLRREWDKAHKEPCPVSLVIKSFQHDFGTYKEVCAKYDENDEKQFDAALWFEANLPSNWDEEAKEVLRR